jgi:hypothetical protein
MFTAGVGIHHSVKSPIEVGGFPVFSGNGCFELSDSFLQSRFLGAVLAHLFPQSAEQRTANKSLLAIAASLCFFGVIF